MLKLAASEWGERLAGLEAEEIKHGLDTWESDWPPTLPEFKRACKPKQHAAHKINQALPGPKRDKAVGKAAITKMKGDT